MNKGTCLYCLEPLTQAEKGDFHPKCSRQFFDSKLSPVLPYAADQLHELAEQVVGRSISVTGVQPKLSLDFQKDIKAGLLRLTLVGLRGNFILKPPNPQFPEIVENEHLTMRLAKLFGIRTAHFSFIRLQSGELAYLTRRMDRTGQQKLAMEDLCQLSGRLTEYKYRGSVEQVAKVIRRHTAFPGLDVLRFYEVVLFSFLTGNADMHLKNYSLLTQANGDTGLAPAYDLLSTKLHIPEDPEESALTINGKKSRIGLNDFRAFAINAGIPPKAAENVHQRFFKKRQDALIDIDRSFLRDQMKRMYAEIFNERLDRIYEG